MTRFHRIDRRTFLHDAGRSGIAIALMGSATASVLVGCSDDDGAAVEGTGVGTTSGPPTESTPAATAPPDTAEAAPAPEGYRWEQVSFGFVSAYVLARGDDVVLVDTGTSGEASRFEPALGALGVGWDAVDHVVLTHLHGDHVGGLGPVLEAAPDATAHAGEADLQGIDAPRALEGLSGGEEILGLQIIATPGHTAGHVSVFDPGAGLFVAGDALTGADGGVTGPNPDFTDDMASALASIAGLRGLGIETVLPGHGPPVEGNAGASIEELA